jgi:cytochrome c oxidase subunit 2
MSAARAHKVIVLSLLLGWPASVRAAENLSIFSPDSPPAASIRDLFLLVLGITGAIFLLVEGVLIYNIYRFRRKAGDGPSEPPQVYGSKPIEIAWTAAPALICFLLMLLLIRTEYEVRVDPPAPKKGDQALYVTVIGHQFWWQYYYDTYDGQQLGFNTANELRVPVGRKVYLTLKSADVCHSFWVPRLAGKTDLIPGRTNYMWFQPNNRGLFLGQCAEFCGTQHAGMLLRVEVDSVEDFEGWLVNQQKPAVEAPKARKGRDKFLSVSCINCHAVRGTRAAGTFGPDLTHLMSRQTLLTGLAPNDRPSLWKWIDDPQSMKEGCTMPAMKLSEPDVDLVVDYLRTLK